MKLLNTYYDTIILSTKSYSTTRVTDLVEAKKEMFEDGDEIDLDKRIYTLSKQFNVEVIMEPYTFGGLDVVFRDSSNRFLFGATNRGATRRVQVKILATELFRYQNHMNKTMRDLNRILKCLGVTGGATSMGIQAVDIAFDFLVPRTERDKAIYLEMIERISKRRGSKEDKDQIIRNCDTKLLESVSTIKKGETSSIKIYDKGEELFANDDEEKRNLIFPSYFGKTFFSPHSYRQDPNCVIRVEFGFKGKYLKSTDTRNNKRVTKLTSHQIFNGMDEALGLIRHHLGRQAMVKTDWFEDFRDNGTYEKEFERVSYVNDTKRARDLKTAKMVDGIIDWVEADLLHGAVEEDFNFLEKVTWAMDRAGVKAFDRFALLRVMTKYVDDNIYQLSRRVMQSDPLKSIAQGYGVSHVVATKRRVVELLEEFVETKDLEEDNFGTSKAEVLNEKLEGELGEVKKGFVSGGGNLKLSMYEIDGSVKKAALGEA